MTYFDGLNLTADQKQALIANLLKRWTALEAMIEDNAANPIPWEDPKYASIRYARLNGMQAELVEQCEELDPDNFYHRGKAKSRDEYNREQTAMGCDAEGYEMTDVPLACDIESPAGYTTVLADEVACDIGDDWEAEVAKFDPENIDRDGEA